MTEAQKAIWKAIQNVCNGLEPQSRPCSRFVGAEEDMPFVELLRRKLASAGIKAKVLPGLKEKAN